MNRNRKSLEAVHTHTHTNIFSEKWSKGGSREHRDVAILPRDCAWFRTVSN